MFEGLVLAAGLGASASGKGRAHWTSQLQRARACVAEGHLAPSCLSMRSMRQHL